MHIHQETVKCLFRYLIVKNSIAIDINVIINLYKGNNCRCSTAPHNKRWHFNCIQSVCGINFLLTSYWTAENWICVFFIQFFISLILTLVKPSSFNDFITLIEFDHNAWTSDNIYFYFNVLHFTKKISSYNYRHAHKNYLKSIFV